MLKELVFLLGAMFSFSSPAPYERPQKIQAKSIEIVKPAFCQDCYAEGKITSGQARRDLVKMIRVYKRNWSEENIKNVSQVLVFANNNSDYRIDYKLMISFFGHESHMLIDARGGYLNKRNTDGTVDYGIGQHNSKYYRERFQYALYIQKKYNILPGKNGTMNPYDPITGSIATMVYLKSIRDSELYPIYLRTGIPFSKRDLIMAYNMGTGGMLANYNYISTKTPYYVAIAEHYNIL